MTPNTPVSWPNRFAKKPEIRMPLRKSWILDFAGGFLPIPAGIGFATLRATVKLWLGDDTSRCGVFSAGNGPVMRSAVLGTAIDDLDLLQDYVRASTRITLTELKVFHGALAVAIAAGCVKHSVRRKVAPQRHSPNSLDATS